MLTVRTKNILFSSKNKFVVLNVRITVCCRQMHVKYCVYLLGWRMQSGYYQERDMEGASVICNNQLSSGTKGLLYYSLHLCLCLKHFIYV